MAVTDSQLGREGKSKWTQSSLHFPATNLYGMMADLYTEMLTPESLHVQESAAGSYIVWGLHLPMGEGKQWEGHISKSICRSFFFFPSINPETALNVYFSLALP